MQEIYTSKYGTIFHALKFRKKRATMFILFKSEQQTNGFSKLAQQIMYCGEWKNITNTIKKIFIFCGYRPVIQNILL